MINEKGIYCFDANRKSAQTAKTSKPLYNPDFDYIRNIQTYTNLYKLAQIYFLQTTIIQNPKDNLTRHTRKYCRNLKTDIQNNNSEAEI